MWNERKSLNLSLIIARCVLALAVVLLLILPVIIGMYLDYRGFSHSHMWRIAIPCYFSGPFIVVLLFQVDRLLHRLKKGRVFIEENTSAIRIISWCCFGAGFVFLVASFFYIAFIFIALPAGFCGLIIRVLKNVFAAAVQIKDENDYTI